jgi:hypothetical protein
MRVEGLGGGSTGKIGPALIELDERALDLLLVRLLLRKAGERAQQQSGRELHEIDFSRGYFFFSKASSFFLRPRPQA